MPHDFPDLYDLAELGEVAASGAERARGALSTLLERDMVVTTSHASHVDDPSPEIIEHLSSAAAEPGATVGRLGIDGPPDGAAWVAFPAACVRQLLDSFQMGSSEIGGAEARSMVAEVANIVTGSFLTELGDAWGTELDPTPADLDAGIAQARVDLAGAAAAPEPSVLSLGCGFSTGEASWDLSVYLLLSTAPGTTPHN